MLSPKATKILDQYFNLPFSGVGNVRCPYFNNAKIGNRGQLRALIGKGKPQEIVEEAKIISIQYHKGLFIKDGHCCLHGHHDNKYTSSEEIRKFLIDNNLGVDCSAFITHILNEHYKETSEMDILSRLPRSYKLGFIRSLICCLRPVENIGVRAYASDINSKQIHDFSDIKPADYIILIGIGAQKKHNHILLITDRQNDMITYAHSRAWSSEGMYGHGVSRGQIQLIANDNILLNQRWIESENTNEQNETYLEAKQASQLEVRRIKY